MTERDQRLQAIRERYEASTPGEWMSHSSEYPEETYVYSESEDFIYENLYDVDAEFIAHAHQDIPWLLAEIERLEAELDKLPRDEYMMFPPTATRK